MLRQYWQRSIHISTCWKGTWLRQLTSTVCSRVQVRYAIPGYYSKMNSFEHISIDVYISTDIYGHYRTISNPQHLYYLCNKPKAELQYLWSMTYIICILQILTNPRNPACKSYATQKAQHAASRSFLWYLVILQDTYGFKDVWSALSTTIFCPYYHLSGA